MNRTARHRLGRRRRNTLRLPDHDYSGPGTYFVTICPRDREPLFADERCREVVSYAWKALDGYLGCVALDAFVVMPNHVHGILIFAEQDRGTDGVGADGRPISEINTDHRPSAPIRGTALFLPLKGGGHHE